jgi:Putative Ig domain
MCMQPLNKNILWVLLLAASLQVSWAFSLGGPIGNAGDNWQVPAIGYGLTGDLNAPKNLGEEYRRNLPVMYYTYDANFFDYFGAAGATSVDSAFAILNALTNVDQYSAQLTEFPIESRHLNYQAQALGLFDLKSFTLQEMMEQLGLTDPVRYAWTLHDRYLPTAATCPSGEEYLVVQRNFDYFSTPQNQLQYSPYINNTLYSYQIFEKCTGTDPLARTFPFSVDPLADVSSSLAAGSIGWGDYYSGLTRDDVAGLRYLLSTNNMNWEDISGNSTLGVISTNKTSPQSFPPIGASGTNVAGFYYYSGGTNSGFGYGDLAPFIGFIKTNNLAAVQAAYPGVIITSSSNSLVWSTNQSYSFYYTNKIGSPYGSPPTFVVVTNYTGYWQTFYYYQFGNIITNHYFTNTAAGWQTLTVSAPLGSPYGTPTLTNSTIKLTNQISGDFFVLPQFQDGVCPLDIIDGTHYNVVASTNLLTGGATTFGTTTNTTSVSNAVYLITYFTNYSFAINPVTCTQATSGPGLYQGIGRIQYVRADYDSLLGQYWQPVTNYYSMTIVTNGKAAKQRFQRVVTQPDILFSASDLTAGPAGAPANLVFSRNLNFDTNNILSTLAGPGTITTPTKIAFNKDGPVYFNAYSDTMDGTTYFNQTPGRDITDLFYQAYFVWASYDGTTNAPTVFPNGTSIADLQNQVLIQVSPASPLPDGGAGFDYSVDGVQFTATGGSLTPPYTWTANNLPDGLVLDSTSGALTGVPTQSGIFDFTLILTDSLGKSVQWGYTITIQ